MKSKIKNIIIFLVIFGLLIAVYGFFFRPSPAPVLVGTSGVPVSPAAPTSSQISQEFLSLLLSIKNINLDDAIFSNPAFGVLQDYTIILVPEGNEGRVNPFAPIGVDVSSAEATSPVSPESVSPESVSPESVSPES